MLRDSLLILTVICSRSKEVNEEIMTIATTALHFVCSCCWRSPAAP